MGFCHLLPEDGGLRCGVFWSLRSSSHVGRITGFWLVFVAAMEETGSNETISDVDMIGGMPLKAGFRSDYMGSNMQTGRPGRSS